MQKNSVHTSQQIVSPMKHSIGIYSGTFDPIHVGHITFAQATARALALDAIVFLPEQQPRGKQHVTDIRHRAELIKRAIQDDEKLQVLTIPSKQFTVTRTLPELQKHFKDASFTLLMGSDIVRTFTHRWDGLETLLKEAEFAVGMREGDNQNELEAIFAQLETQYRMPIARRYITTKNAHIASTQLRANAAALSQLPHPTMINYIRENQLYTDT